MKGFERNNFFLGGNKKGRTKGIVKSGSFQVPS